MATAAPVAGLLPGIDAVPTSVREWQELAEKLVHIAELVGMTKEEVQLRNILRVRSIQTVARLSGSTMKPAEFLLLRAIHPKVYYSHTQARDQLKRMSLLDDDSYSRGLGLLGLDENLVVVDHPKQEGLDQSTKNIHPVVLSGPTHSASSKSAGPSRHTAGASPPTSTPKKPSSRHSSQPLAPKKATSHSKEKGMSQNPFPTLHAAIKIFSSNLPVTTELGNIKSMAATLGPFFPAYKSLAAINAIPLPAPLSVSSFAAKMAGPPLTTPEGSPKSQPTSSSLSGLGLDDSPTYRLGKNIAPGASGQKDRPSPPHDNDDGEVSDDPPASKDETLITVFATSFFNAFSSFVGGTRPEHQMLPIRELFRCAPLNDSGLPKGFQYFKAAVDAVVPTMEAELSHSYDEDEVGYLFISEFKRHRLDDLGTAILRQETAEVAAFIASQQAALSAGKRGGLAKLRCVLLLSQYHLRIFLTLAEYDQEWLDYILKGDRPALADGLQEKHMLRMRRLGTYEIMNPRHMYELVSILAAILLKDSKNTKGKRG